MGIIDRFKAYLNEEDTSDEELLNEQLKKEAARKALKEEKRAAREDERLRKKALKSGTESQAEDEETPIEKNPKSKNKRSKKSKARKNFKEGRVDLDDEDVLAEMKGTHTVNAEVKAVQDFCEQLVDVTYHMEDMRREYQMVTGYLTDIQRIEELPVDMAVDIIDIAKKIEMLDKSRETYLQSEDLLSMEQYKLMVKYEDEIPDTVKKLNEMEVRDSMLKNDMGHLEGEKESLKYRREDCTDSINRIRGILMTILILAIVTCVGLFFVAYSTRKSITMYMLIIGAVALLFFAISYTKYVELKAEIKESDAKYKRAISLLNKVKAKYINNTSTLDYIYDKYGVNSSKELEYNWVQYNTMIKDAMKYTQANSDFRRYCDMLVDKLARIGLKDPLVWPKQTSALIDRREMVEIKHALNVRRQKIREKLAACEKIQDNAKIALKAAVEINPAMESFIREILTPFKVNVEDK